MSERRGAKKRKTGGGGSQGTETAAASAPTTTTAGAMFHCDYCHKDISGRVRIKCAECTDFDLCVECYSVGVEIRGHKSSHAYRVMENQSYPLFTEDWGCDEELLLLEAIELYGMGNWLDVGEHVGTKSPDDCKAHYYAVYVNVPTHPLPDMTNLLTTKSNIKKYLAAPRKRTPLSWKKTDEKGKVNTRSKQKESGKTTKTGSSLPPYKLNNLGGYMPRRDDYEIDWMNDLELAYQDLEFKEEDPPEDIALKLAVLQMYNEKLDERAFRKGFLKERKLLDLNSQQLTDRKRIKDEKDLYDKYKVFARFHSREEHEQLMVGLVNEMRIRKRIQQLRDARRNGTIQLNKGKMANRHTGGKRDRNEYTSSGRRAQLDLSTLSGTELLSTTERELCANLRLRPSLYMSIKEAMVCECLKRGQLKRLHATKMFPSMDANVMGMLYTYMVYSGWVSGSPLDMDARPTE